MTDDPRRQPSDRWLAIRARQAETGEEFNEAAAAVDAERGVTQPGGEGGTVN